MSVPKPYHRLAPNEDEAREWWRWSFAGQIAAAIAGRVFTMPFPEPMDEDVKRMAAEISTAELAAAMADRLVDTLDDE